MGHAITMHRPIFATAMVMPDLPDNVHCFAITGTPADCVKLAVEELLPRRPDLVVSGINRGWNLGTDVFYSGTVSAAIEATIHGIPAVAVSYGALEREDYEAAAAFTVRLAREVGRRGLPPGILLNVNVPAVEPDLLAGVAVTRLGVRTYRNQWVRRRNPRGKTYYWLAGEVLDEENVPDSDVVAIQNQKISVTPIHLDLTDHTFRETLETWTILNAHDAP